MFKGIKRLFTEEKMYMTHTNISSDPRNTKHDYSKVPVYMHLITKIKMNDHSKGRRYVNLGFM